MKPRTSNNNIFLICCRRLVTEFPDSSFYNPSSVGGMDDCDFTSFSTLLESYQDNVVVVVLLFYVHSKHLRSRRNGQLT